MSSIKTVFAARLKELRKKRGLTQEQLAEMLGVAPRHISFIETAKSFPSGDLIERICSKLNIKYSYLFDGEQPTGEELLQKTTSLISKFDNKKLQIIYNIASEL